MPEIIQKNITWVRSSSQNIACTNFDTLIEPEDYSILLNKYYTSRKIYSPKILENLNLNHLVFSLIWNDPYSIIKLIEEEMNINRDIIDLWKDYNLEAFMALIKITAEGKKNISHVVIQVQEEGIDWYYNSLMETLLNKNLLWRNTRSKFWYVKKYSNSTDISNNLRNIISVITQKQTITESYWISEILGHMIILLKIIELWWTKITHFCYNDIVNSALWYVSTFTVDEITLSAQYAQRDPSYLLLGNIYWDCTAIQKVKQADDVKNIFWTKAAWILNPFYQILEIQYQEKAVIKIHLLLAVFRGRIALCIDAIETTVWMREYTSNSDKEWTKNTNLGPVFHLRFKILEKAMFIIRWIAEAIWTETVIIEEYSNTTWVRSWLQKYQQIHFHTHELHEINHGDIVDSIFYKESWGRNISGKKVEIQLLNTELQDKWLKSGVNSARVLIWSVWDISQPFRGI